MRISSKAFTRTLVALLATALLLPGLQAVSGTPPDTGPQKAPQVEGPLGKEGYDTESATRAQLQVERVVSQLQEITGFSGEENPEHAPYRLLLEKIDLPAAVSLLLDLEKDFGSMEEVLEEYLYALQAGLDLEQYREDPAGYLKAKEEKAAEIDPDSLLSLDKIEEKFLSMLQNNNPNKAGTGADGSWPREKDNFPETVPTEEIPEIPLPQVGPVRPEDPLAKAMEEIQSLRNGSLDIHQGIGKEQPK